MIPVNEPLLGERELAYVVDAVRTGWISSAGKYIEQFEAAWARYCGMKHGVAVSNGTTALQVAVRCARLAPGDEVIMPSFTIISCALAVVYAGGVPVVVDADPETWTMDVGQVEAQATARTRAIMPVHIYGHPCDMDPLREIARRRGLLVIEDAAEAHGAEYRGRRCGGLGDLSCFSFYANKIVTTGEGGMVLTDDDALAAAARGFRNLCFGREERFRHADLGYNFRMTNLQAAVGLAQVERVDELVARKRAMGRAYTERLRAVPELELPVERPWAKNVYWMYGVMLKRETGLRAADFAKELALRGVETRPFFLGLHDQPALQGRMRAGPCPVADRMARQGLYLPSGLALTEGDIERVVGAVKEALQRLRARA